MRRINRRQFTWMATGGVASAALVGCGTSDAVDADLSPTMIPDVAGAPPTLAPQATPFESPQEEEPAEATPAEGEEATPAEEAAPEQEQAEEGGGEEAASGGGGEAITVEGLDTLRFEPDAIEASPGQAILFVNVGVLQHNLVVEELGIDMPFLNGGEEQEVTVPDGAAPGEYEFICSYPGHEPAGMVGVLTVV